MDARPPSPRLRSSILQVVAPGDRHGLELYCSINTDRVKRRIQQAPDVSRVLFRRPYVLKSNWANSPKA